MPTDAIIWPYTMAVRYLDNERERVEKQIVAYAIPLAERVLHDHGQAASDFWLTILEECMPNTTKYLVGQQIVPEAMSPLDTSPYRGDRIAPPKHQRTYGKSFEQAIVSVLSIILGRWHNRFQFNPRFVPLAVAETLEYVRRDHPNIQRQISWFDQAAADFFKRYPHEEAPAHAADWIRWVAMDDTADLYLATAYDHLSPYHWMWRELEELRIIRWPDRTEHTRGKTA